MIPLAVLLFACKIDVATARALIQAKTVKKLDAVYRRVPKNNVAMRALYRHQRLELHPTAGEELTFLRTLPSTERQFACIYGLGELYNHEEGEEFSPASDTVYDDFTIAARLAAKHHTAHGRVLRYILATTSNAEVGEVSFPAINIMLDGDPEGTAAAIRRLPLKDQEQLCGSDMRKRSTKFIVEHCKSDL